MSSSPEYSTKYNSFVANLDYNNDAQQFINLNATPLDAYFVVAKATKKSHTDGSKSYDISMCTADPRTKNGYSCGRFGEATLKDPELNSYSMQFEGVDSQCDVRLSAPPENGTPEVEQITCMAFDNSMKPAFMHYRLKDLDKQQRTTFMFPSHVLAGRQINNDSHIHKEQQPIAQTPAGTGSCPCECWQ